ncbi:MAG: alpha/beta hydrolase [Promethearchaeota archaeon]
MQKKRSRILFSILFITLEVVGILFLNFYPINVVRETRVTRTADDVRISYNLYYSRDGTIGNPVIFIGHGVIVNKEMMTNFAIELAARNFVVVNLDWRAHGRSSGTLETEKLIMDLEAVLNDVHARMPTANISKLGMIGYSMGGFPTFLYAATHDTVKAWVGVGTAVDPSVSDEKVPNNVLLICGDLDEAFSVNDLRHQMTSITPGISDVSNFQFNRLYGSIENGTARELIRVPLADHLVVPWHPTFIHEATKWMVRTFEGNEAALSFFYNDIRVIFLLLGMIGLGGTLVSFSLALGSARHLRLKGKTSAQSRESGEKNQREGTIKFVAKYYMYTLVLLPAGVLPGLTFLAPLFFTSLLSTLVSTLAIGMFVFSWVVLKKRGVSYLNRLKTSLISSKNAWIIGLIVTGFFLFGYYLIIGLNYLGIIPSLERIWAIFLYGAMIFFSLLIFEVFSQEIAVPIIETKLRSRRSKVKFLMEGAFVFALLYSWFFIIIEAMCLTIQNNFLVMVLILMVPIFLFTSYHGLFTRKTMGTFIPNLLLQTTLITLILVTLSPWGSLLRLFS